MSEWKEWDTAPRDGRIIMAHMNREVRLVQWYPMLGGMSHPWADPSATRAWPDNVFTEWMNLPEPPK